MMLKKIFINALNEEFPIIESSFNRRVNNLKVIWAYNDYGIERLIRLFLASIQFILPGIYLRSLVNTNVHRDLLIDLFVILKIVYSISFVYYGFDSIYLIILLSIFLIETVLYVPSLIFASDYLSRPRSYKRSMKLLFLNYIQILMDFAALYSIWPSGFNKELNWFDYIYFSTCTINTIGYGDISPIMPETKLLVCLQSIIGLMFVVLFINIFSTRMKMNGYFED